jgi:hypothetical protein
MFVLAEHRDADAVAAFKRYSRYLERNRRRFPKSAYSLATSDWYFGFNDHRAPHDAWLESATIGEVASGKRSEVRFPKLTIRLLSAYHDGFIELAYPKVYDYDLKGVDVTTGHRDWRYDELRIDKKGRLVHEIEWCGMKETGRWLIVASDVIHKWIPKE